MPAKSAKSQIASLFDSFEPMAPVPVAADPLGFPDYPADAAESARSTDSDEAVICGEGSCGGSPLVAAVFEFGFLGGSMGRAVGTAIEAAMDRAVDLGVPFVAVTSSGGARMQEGMLSLAQMPRTVAASMRLAAAGVPRISILCHPTTGGVYASFASIADFTAAESGATIGFAGPRVAETMTGKALPTGSHTAEAAFEAGLVDAVMQIEDIRAWLSDLLQLLNQTKPFATGAAAAAEPPLPSTRSQSPSAWETFQIARDDDRPKPTQLVKLMASKIVEMHGDRAGSDDVAVFTAIAAIDDRAMIVAAIDRKSPTAAGFRQLRRAIETSGRLGLPLLTIIDTPGADPSYESEYSGLAAEIAKTFAAILSVQVSVLSIVTGEGGSGGALAIACGDRIAMLEHAVFSVIAPEGAASILYRDARRAPEVAEHLKPAAPDLVSMGLIDDIVTEPRPSAAADHPATADAIKRWVASSIRSVRADPASRAARFRV